MVVSVKGTGYRADRLGLLLQIKTSKHFVYVFEVLLFFVS